MATFIGDDNANDLSGTPTAFDPTTGDPILVSDNIYGRGGDDTLHAAGYDTLYGEAGNDILYARYGHNDFSGGDGNDTVDYSQADLLAGGVFASIGESIGGGAGYADAIGLDVENLTGTQFGDTLFGSDGNNVLKGEADPTSGFAGDDVLYGLGGDDSLYGGGGFDRLYGDVGADSLYGGGGEDLLRGGDGDDLLEGGAGPDTLIGGAGAHDLAVYLNSTAGVTVTIGAYGSGGEAEGDLVGPDVEDIMGSFFADVLTGSAADNVLYGEFPFAATGGDDRLSGLDGNDSLLGLLGNDTLSGDAGDDALDGGPGNDVLHGGAGTDSLDGGAGADILDGGDGIDTVTFSYSPAGVTVSLNGQAVSGGDAQGDTYIGIENLEGSDQSDALTGNGLANALFGNAGNDVLRGGAGADHLDGGAGIDTVSYTTSATGVTVNLNTRAGSGGDAQGDTYTGIENVNGSQGADTITGNILANVLNGWAGRDVLTGLAGADLFVFSALSHSAVSANADRITDFSHAQGDRIDLHLIDANSTVAGDQAFHFIGGAAFGHHAGELRESISGGSTTVTADVNGDGVADFSLSLSGSITLVAADFAL